MVEINLSYNYIYDINFEKIIKDIYELNISHNELTDIKLIGNPDDDPISIKILDIEFNRCKINNLYLENIDIEDI